MRKLILASLTISGALVLARTLDAQTNSRRHGSLQRRLDGLLDQRPFDRVTWGVYVQDDRGRVLYQRNADRLFVPASDTKLVVSATAATLLPPDYRVRTSVYVNGTLRDGVVDGDLVLYGRGDPTFSERCFGVDTLAPGACDSTFTAMDAIADSLVARGVRRVAGRLIGDGSYFEPTIVHPGWDEFDLNWWYAAPVSGLGFHDNSVDFRITPSDSLGRPPTISWTPELGLFTFENRARTGPTDSGSTIGDNFFRKPGTMDIWAEGTAAQGRSPWVESFALPDPNLYAARALAHSLEARGVPVLGGTASTTDSLDLRAVRCCGAPLVEFRGRPLSDILFPILNTSQNWFAEMLLKVVGRELGGAGSWDAGLEAERHFLVDSIHIDSTAFSLEDGSGLSAGNLVSPHAFVQILNYMYAHPKRAAFLAALPRSGKPGSLLHRFVGTPLEGRVLAKTGSIDRVNTLSGYIERPDGHPLIFSIEANAHTIGGRSMLSQIDSIVVEIGKTQ
ncbi:MAG TPA: D-alanyl-D-alanine carboxypeptidase/D-alanyl-D-alanine-endopeptidase [Gemmatimonadales bacterium]|nr:D-alanyl-D-alanine carboxypeptidase/D-alanyl-D-alanine-endopeptidase [Gemmatimonadales bacterium]